jgi:hypothetical protein
MCVPGPRQRLAATTHAAVSPLHPRASWLCDFNRRDFVMRRIFWTGTLPCLPAGRSAGTSSSFWLSLAVARMHVDLSCRPSLAGGRVDVDPEHDRELPSRPSTYTLCLVVGLSALSQSPVPGGSSIRCVRHSLASLRPLRNCAAREVESSSRASSTPPSPSLVRHRNFWRYYTSCARGRTRWVGFTEGTWVSLADSEQLGSQEVILSTQRSGTKGATYG